MQLLKSTFTTAQLYDAEQQEILRIETAETQLRSAIRLSKTEDMRRIITGCPAVLDSGYHNFLMHAYTHYKHHNDISPMRVLLELGCNIHTDMLSLAANEKEILVVRLLLDHKANVNLEPMNIILEKPLIEAIATHDLELVTLLLDAGADCTIDLEHALKDVVLKKNIVLLELLFSRGVVITESVFLTALREGNTDVLDVLMQQKIAVDGSIEFTKLQRASRHSKNPFIWNNLCWHPASVLARLKAQEPNQSDVLVGPEVLGSPLLFTQYNEPLFAEKTEQEKSLLLRILYRQKNTICDLQTYLSQMIQKNTPNCENYGFVKNYLSLLSETQQRIQTRIDAFARYEALQLQYFSGFFGRTRDKNTVKITHTVLHQDVIVGIMKKSLPAYTAQYDIQKNIIEHACATVFPTQYSWPIISKKRKRND